MKQYVSRRRRCWTLLTQMDPEIHLSDELRSDTLLDLSGLTREERVMLQASISNERDIDRVAEALIIQHPRIHLRESQRRAKGKRKDGFKCVHNPNARWFRGRGKGKHTGSGKSGTSAHHANLSSVEDYDYFDEHMDESANAYQAHNDPVDPGSDDEEESPDYDDDEENDTFSPYVEAALDDDDEDYVDDALDDVTVFEAAELVAIALLADTARSFWMAFNLDDYYKIRGWSELLHAQKIDLFLSIVLYQRSGGVLVRCLVHSVSAPTKPTPVATPQTPENTFWDTWANTHTSNTVVFSCFFLHSGRMFLSFFLGGDKLCDRIGNEMPRKRTIFISQRGGFNWTKKRWRRTSLHHTVLRLRHKGGEHQHTWSDVAELHSERRYGHRQARVMFQDS